MARSAGWVAFFLAAIFASASPCLAKAPATPPDSLANSPASWLDTDGWTLLLGSAYADTLDAPVPQVIHAAELALIADDWVLQHGHAGWQAADAGHRVVTGWKPIRNIIFRLLAGHSVARCFASVAAMRDGRTELTFQGGLAARRDLRHSAMRSVAERSYRNAVLVWQREVRDALAGAGRGTGSTRSGSWLHHSAVPHGATS